MKSGWVKVYRKLLDHEIFKSKDDKLFKTFIYCLLRANHKENEILFNGQKVKLSPGQFITSRNNASRDLGFSPKTFDRKIQILQKWEILTRNLRDKHDPLNGTKMTQNMTHLFSLISITNWETYQGRPDKDDPEHDPEHDPLNGTNMTPDKKNKEGKKYFVQGSIELELSSFLLEEIRKNKPDFKEPNLQAWSKDFDLMIRRDKREPDRIKKVVSWVQADSFWFKNILSPGKLRKQFDRIEMEMREKTPSLLKGGVPKRSEDPGAERRREMAAAEAVPCPPGLRPAFLRESET